MSAILNHMQTTWSLRRPPKGMGYKISFNWGRIVYNTTRQNFGIIIVHEVKRKDGGKDVIGSTLPETSRCLCGGLGGCVDAGKWMGKERMLKK